MNYSDFPFTLNVFNHVKHRELPCVWSRLALPKGQSEKHRKIYSGKWSQCIFLHMQMYEKHYSDVGANSIYWRKKKEYVCSSMKKDKMTHSALTCFARLYVCQFSALSCPFLLGTRLKASASLLLTLTSWTLAHGSLPRPTPGIRHRSTLGF